MPHKIPGWSRSPSLLKPSWMSGRHRLPERTRLNTYLLLAGLLVATYFCSTVVGGLTRPLFILGCVYVAWRALKVGPGLHAEVVIVLFAFSPFLRRIVDASAGYNPSGIMLVGPLLALAVPLRELKTLLLQPSPIKRTVYTPYLIMTGCLTYAWALSAFHGVFADATVLVGKMLIPMLYGVYLIRRSDAAEEVLQSIARAFLFITPIISVYGLLQYLNPQPWDRYWMLNSTELTSIGRPEPMQLRVFSTLNSPASFGVFAACGLLFYGFCSRSWLSIAMILPTCLALLLSFYRTAWIGIGIGVIFCLIFNTTRGRASWLTICLLGTGVAAVLLTPFGTQVAERLGTLLGDPAQDGSGHDRMREFIYLYSDMDHYLFGVGLSDAARVASAKILGIDGQLIASAIIMGIVIGNIHVLALIWACLQGMPSLDQKTPPIWLVAGAIIIGNVLVIPLAILSTGETSFPIWSLAALLTARQQHKTLLPARRLSPATPIAWHYPARTRANSSHPG